MPLVQSDLKAKSLYYFVSVDKFCPVLRLQIECIGVVFKTEKEETLKSHTMEPNEKSSQDHLEDSGAYPTTSKPYKMTSDPCDVKLIGFLGNDLTVVNAARLSFGVEHQTLTAQDIRLIDYLARHDHMSPFRHCMLQFKIRAPEFVWRQAWKHNIGCEWTAGSSHQFKDSPLNEISGRYTEYDDIYIPKEWCSQHPSAKQCSGSVLEEQAGPSSVYLDSVDRSMRAYKSLLAGGVSKEQSRMVLPLCFMTDVLWTASLQAVQNFVTLRNSPHAQMEIRVLAQKVEAIALEKFPHSFEVLLKYASKSAAAKEGPNQ